jgi:hypothetical protein
VTDLHTDADLRAEAARQYAEALRSPDRVEVGDEMQGAPIPSRSSSEPFHWGQLSGDDFHDAGNEVHQLLDDAPDLSRWAVDLGANCLTKTTELMWGHPTNWSLAVQVAHRRHLADDLHTELVKAISSAVSAVLDGRDIDCPRLT